MPRVIVTAQRRINAPVDSVAECIRDYEQHHPQFLPPVFSDFTVEAGGVGAGTVISYTVTVANRPRAYRDVITEPEPGRVIVESDPEWSKSTTFRLTPPGDQTGVKITTTFPTSRGGPAGMIERWLAPRLLRPVYADELQRLDAYAARLAPAAPA